MKFSDRLGITQVKTVIQLDDIDDDLRIALWNVIYKYMLRYGQNEEGLDIVSQSKYRSFFFELWDFWKLQQDTLNLNPFLLNPTIKDTFFDLVWYEVYNFIEFVTKKPPNLGVDWYSLMFNEVLERELSAFRFIDGELVPIIDKEQINQIQAAIDTSSEFGLNGVHTHLKTALSKLSIKPKPDCRNSIKESISAVEAITKIIAGKKNATMNDALNTLKGKISLHGSLVAGFKNLYGWTSSDAGIRHDLQDEDSLDVEDAIYMLTSCSAFINYLIVKADKAGIKLNVKN